MHKYDYKNYYSIRKIIFPISRSHPAYIMFNISVIPYMSESNNQSIQTNIIYFNTYINPRKILKIEFR